MESPADPALSELLARMHWVRGLAGALVRDADRADDLAQDAWVRALRAGPAQAASWRGWFARVMKNRVADEGRLQGQHARFTARQPRAGGSPSEEEIRQQMETHEALSEAMRALPDPYRRAVFLRYFEGWSLARIAAEDGCDKRAIEKRLRQARAMLRAHLERRAPAEHWAAGLLLLAPAPQKVATLAVAAALIAIALIVPAGWILWPGPDASPSATLVQAVPALVEDPAGPAGASSTEPAPPPGFLPEALDRAAVEVSSPTFEIALLVVDKLTTVGIPGVEVQIDCEDTAGRVLESGQGITDAQGRLSLFFTCASIQAHVTIRPGSSQYAAGPRSAFGWVKPRALIEWTYSLEPLRGVMRGTVLDEADHPVPGAFVDAWRNGDELNSARPDISVQSDQDGRFEITQIRQEGDRVTLAPRATGRYSTRRFVVDDRFPIEALVEGVELTLSSGRPFSVRVVDERGQPIKGARVAIWPGSGSDNFELREDGQYHGRHQFNRITNAEGGIAPVMIGYEVWQVNVSHPAFKERDTTLVPDAESLLVMLEPGRVVRGVLHGVDGMPAPRIAVVVEGPAGTEEARTDEQGAFLTRAPGDVGDEVRILCLPQRHFSFHVVGPLVPDGLSGPIDITLPVGENLNFKLVYADGSPYDRMQDVQWEVLDGPMARAPGGDASTAQSWLKLRPVNDRDIFSEVGFIENVFHFFQCPPGTYRFRFTNSQGLLGEADVTTGVKDQEIVLPGASTAHGVFHGRVVLAGSMAALTRFDVNGHRYAGPEERTPLDGWGMGGLVQDSEGRFRYEKLITGWWEFTIEATRDLTHWRSGRIWIESEGAPLTVAVDQVMAGELTLLYPDGTPAAECRVSFADERNELLFFARKVNEGSLLADQTDGAGRLSVARLPRTMPFQIWVTPRSGPTRVVPAGALDPGRTAWTVHLPE